MNPFLMHFTFDGDQLKMELVAPTGVRFDPPTAEKQEPKNVVIMRSKMQ